MDWRVAAGSGPSRRGRTCPRCRHLGQSQFLVAVVRCRALLHVMRCAMNVPSSRTSMRARTPHVSNMVPWGRCSVGPAAALVLVTAFPAPHRQGSCPVAGPGIWDGAAAWSAVHSVKPTWATSRGSTQVAPRINWAARGRARTTAPAARGQPGPHAGWSGCAGRSRCRPCRRFRQLAVAVVVAEQQGAEPGAGSPRVGVPADDELLPVLALELQPVPGPSPEPVGRVGPLGDDPSSPGRRPPASTARGRCPGAV